MAKNILLTVILVSSTPVAAQLPTGANPALQSQSSQLPTLKIQGSKDQRTYEQSVQSISVVPAQQLDSPVQADSVQVLNALPNVSVNRNDDSFSLRGVNNTGVTGFQKDNLSSILVDDVFQTDLAVKAGSFDLWDVQHIEVHRGPQSTTQGVNSLAGSLLVFHNKSSIQNEQAFKLGYGSFNKLEAGLMANRTWLDGKLLSRLTFNNESSDGFIKNVKTNNSKWGAKSKDHLALDLVYNLQDQNFVRLNTKVMQNNNGGAYVQSANPFDAEVNEDVDFQSKTANQQSSLRYFKSINSHWTNEVISAVSFSHNDQTSDADGLPQNLAGTRFETHQDRFLSLENLLKYQNTNWKNVLGFHAHDFTLHDDYNFKILYPLSATVSTPIETQQTTDKARTVLAVFNSATYQWEEHHSVTLGLRYELVKNKYGADVQAQRTQNLGPTINTAVDTYLAQVQGDYESTNENSILLPKAAYTYEWNSHTYGASYSEGYRTGGLSINRRKAKTDEYNPEQTANYEVSHKFEANSWRVSSNIFYTRWKDQQVLVQLSNDIYDSQVMNAADSELYGAEVESQMQFSSLHTLGASVGYVKTRFNSFTSNGVDYGENEFPFAPQWTGRLFYTWNINDNWSTSSIFRYLSTSYSNAENTREVPEQFYLDLLSQYRFSSWNLVGDFYVRNLLNNQYLTFDGRPKNPGSAYTATYNQISAPQELGVRFTYLW